jgi:hypothetical protein
VRKVGGKGRRNKVWHEGMKKEGGEGRKEGKEGRK